MTLLPGSDGDTVAECTACNRWVHPTDLDDYDMCGFCARELDACVAGSPDAETDHGGIAF